MIAAGSIISGMVTIEDNVWIGPGSVTTNRVQFSKDCYIGIGTNVTTNTNPGTKIIGFPRKHMPRF
ncbi:hypothetical protein CMK13_15435 [Candidatus Poribacteria bacterium]|nr:hypothetical protein [Candidatus Poribacteria bacterium]OUT57139.1 MAG: hypothetical protein CBB75_14800 [bacterium TMED15]